MRSAIQDGWSLAVGTLTVIRVRPPTQVNSSVARAGIPLALVVGLIPGGILACVSALMHRAHAPATLTAALGIGAVTWLTRGIHVDGLADTADGLASGGDRERALAVMRSGDTGPAGALAIVLVVFMQVTAIATLLTAYGDSGALLAGLAIAVSRGALALCCRTGVQAARPDGLGAAVAGSVPKPLALITVAASTGLLAAGGALTTIPWWQSSCAAPLGGIAAMLVQSRCVRRLGGVTGDSLGAGVELASVTTLIVLCLG
ncbi:MAG: adenosylcobinamide-GDP ribazoletransferase [Actinomycetota bacterium]